jgi:hypothetical protein
MFSRKFLFASVAAYGYDLFFTNGMRTVPRFISFLEAGTDSANMGRIRSPRLDFNPTRNAKFNSLKDYNYFKMLPSENGIIFGSWIRIRVIVKS